MQLDTFPICNVFESVLTICCKLNEVKWIVWVEWVVQIILLGRRVQVNSGAHWLTKRGDITYTPFLKSVSIQCRSASNANSLISLVNWNAFGVAMRGHVAGMISAHGLMNFETTEVSCGSPMPDTLKLWNTRTVRFTARQRPQALRFLSNTGD